MLTASHSPRLTPPSHQGDAAAPEFRSPSLRRENPNRVGSSKSASPIVKPHSAHVSGFPLPFPSQSSLPAQTHTSSAYAYQNSTSSTTQPQCTSSIDQSSHPPSVRSISTQTLPRPTHISSHRNADRAQSKVVMVDAHTQYSPPLATSPDYESKSTTHQYHSARNTGQSPSSTPTSNLASLRLNKSEAKISRPTYSQANNATIPNTNKRAHDPIADAAMPTAPSGLNAPSGTPRSEGKEEAQARVDSEPSETAQSSAKREHPISITQSYTSSESHLPNGAHKGAQSSLNPVDVPDTPSKKPRPADPDVKIMPLRYETCDTRDLVILISSMLMELVRYNDTIPLTSGSGVDSTSSNLTRFHSRAPPGISVIDYLQRLTTHATLSPPILLSMVYYIDRLASYYPAFTISSLTVHRFLITAATVASKGLSDSFWTNKTYARVGGVTVRELALLELEFLVRVQWRIVPRPETLIDYYKSLVSRSIGYRMEADEVLTVMAGSQDENLNT